MQRRQSLFAFVILCAAIFLGVSTAVAQVNTATLTGQVTDPQALAVRGAKVTLTSAANGSERSVAVDEEGRYTIVGIAPGEYKVRAEGANLAPYENPSLQLTVGEKAVLNIRLELGTQSQTVTVTTESNAVETTRSESAQTVEQRQINNLPINGRGYINFTLLNSQTTRDNAPTIGPAPNSGLNISGARARSNMVSVDGADFGDNSVDGIRTTLSQEAVQEFQMILSNYNAEYGRATGGVVNIVTKSGTNDFHGNVFGFLRNSAFQARNPFSGQVDPTTGQLQPVKQAYTRVQAGLTLGGALKKNKTFYFFSYEYTQREETGFSSIGEGNFGLVPVTLPNGLPVELTQAQAAFVGAVPASLANAYGAVMGSASSVAVNKLDYGALVTQLSGGSITPVNPVVTPGGVLFQEFPLPVPCPESTTINAVNCSTLPAGAAVGANGAFVPAGAAPLPGSYVGLNSIRGNFPTQEKTSLWSARLDQQWNAHNHSFLRVGVSPSYITGIQTTAQNQVLGQNAASRVGVNWLHDLSATFQHDTIVSDSTYNEFRFQFARRSNYFGFSNLPGGSELGVNIPGYAYFGREPYSTVNRIEKRYEFSDNITWTHGHHTFKFGGDVNIIQLRSSKAQIFELDFGGVANFGGLPASSFGLPDCLTPTPGGIVPHNGVCAATDIAVPGATALQAYGFGVPTTYIQGIGNSNQPFDNLPFGFFAQDTWKLTPKLTLNYGLRYDVEISPLFAPATSLNAAAENALGVIEGIPRDYNNFAPRVGVAWDPKGDGKMVVRAGYGIFYDHPLLAIAFNSVTADGGRSVQLISPGGQGTSCGVLTPLSAPAGYPLCKNGLDTPSNLNGSSIFQGVLNALPSMYYQTPGNSQRFDPLQPNSLFANQNYISAGFPLPILPFTLPVRKNFEYGYAQQVNFTVEKQFASNWTLNVGYQGTRGLHLYRPIDINSTDPVLLTTNLQNADAVGLGFTNPLTVAVPTTPNFICGGGTVPNAYNVPGGGSIAFFDPTTGSPLAPGILGLGFPNHNCGGTPVGLISTPAVFNYFRPSGPNPSFATGIGLAAPQCAKNPNPFNCGYALQQALAGAAHYPVGFGVPVPFNSVDAQSSNAASWYNALTVNLQKRFSHGFELLSSYTWSHSIDNGTDLQSTLEPQDSRFPWLERGNSVNDQRHRWVTSGVWQTSAARSGDSFWKHMASNFTLAPIIEVASGRPYNIITGTDSRLDLGASEIRPSVGPSTGTGAFATTSPYVHGFTFGSPNVCLQNDGQPFTVGTGQNTITPPAGCFGSLGRDRFNMPFFFQFDLRVAKRVPLGERLGLDLIADGFNLTNHTNISAVNQLCDPANGASCAAGQPTAAFDARIFQFALKLSW